MEAEGSGLGGILAGLVLIRYFTRFEIAAFVALLDLLAAAWIGVRAPTYRRTWWRCFSLLRSSSRAPLAGSRPVARAALARLQSGGVTEFVYGNLALVATSESRSLFENGLRI